MDSDEELTKKEAKNTTDESTSTAIDNLTFRYESDSDSELFDNKSEFDREVMKNTLKNGRLVSKKSKEILENSKQNNQGPIVAGESRDDEAERRKRLKKERNIRFRMEDSEIEINENQFQELETDDIVSDTATSSSTQTSFRRLNRREAVDEVEEIFYDGNAADDEDDDDEVILQKPKATDSKTTKRKFLAFFESSSRSKVSDESEES